MCKEQGVKKFSSELLGSLWKLSVKTGDMVYSLNGIRSQEDPLDLLFLKKMFYLRETIFFAFGC